MGLKREDFNCSVTLGIDPFALLHAFWINPHPVEVNESFAIGFDRIRKSPPETVNGYIYNAYRKAFTYNFA